MDNDKMAWFGGGVVVGLLIGLGVAAGIGYPKLAAEQARAAKAEEEAVQAMEAARDNAEFMQQVYQNEQHARLKAEEALQQLKKQKPDEKKVK